MSAEDRKNRSEDEEAKQDQQMQENEDGVRSVKRARRESMNQKYQASDPIYSSKRKVAQSKNVKQARKFKTQTKQIKKEKKNSYIKKKKQQKQQTQSSISGSSSDSQSESVLISSCQSLQEQKRQQPAKKKKNSKNKKEEMAQIKKQQQTSPKKENQQPIKHVSKAKGYIYKPPKPKPLKKQESINEMQRQFSRISRKKVRKSNFYLDKIDSMKWGEPVGRGAKKLKEQIQQRDKIRREKEKQRKKQEKKARQLRLKAAVQSQQKKLKRQVVLSDSENQNVRIETKSWDIDKKVSSVIKCQKKPVQDRTKFTLHVYVVQKLIDAYTKNGYDYSQFVKQLPHLKQDQIKYNLDILFEKCINKIQSEYLDTKQHRQQIQLITCQQMGQLLSELHKKKQFSRLLKKQNIDFKEYFNKTLFSITNPESELQPYQIRLLWNHITAFLRAKSEIIVKKQEVFQIEDNQARRQIFEIEDDIKKEDDLVETQNIYTKLQQDKVKQQNQ